MPRKPNSKSYKIKDISGQSFNMLTALRFSHQGNAGQAYWICRCECGNEKSIAARHLKAGKTTSCGCEKKRICGYNRFVHGGSRTREYNSFNSMHERCSDPNHESFYNYGGRGIKVCERWELFQNFFDDMRERPPGTSLDRIDNNGHYEPLNCRWASISLQHENKRSTKGLACNKGERLPIERANANFLADTNSTRKRTTNEKLV